MSNKKDELNDDEYAALLRDLEGKSSAKPPAGGGPKGKAASKAAPQTKGNPPTGTAGPAPSDEVEDIDAFLASLEADDDGPPASTPRARDSSGGEKEDPLAAEFAALMASGALEEPPPEEVKPPSRREQRAEKKEAERAEKEAKKEAAKAEKEAKRQEKKPEDSGLSRKERREAKKEERAAEKEARAAERARKREERPRSKEVLLIALQWFGWLLPAFTLWWVLGAYLGQWISAGWLIFLVSTMFVFTLPLYLKKLIKRGAYKVWLAGFSLLATVALIAPLPNLAGQSMTEYGHWPSSAIAEVAGANPNAGFVRAHASLTGWIGGLVATVDGPNWGARQLGTVYALGYERPQRPEQPTPPSDAPASEAPASEESGETQDSPEPAPETTPQESDAP